MGERRFVEAFLMRKYCRLKGPAIQGLVLGDKSVNVHKYVFCCVGIFYIVTMIQGFFLRFD